MIVVDAANVVGSRPDGWWKDRAGANRRLVDDLAGAVEAGRVASPVVVVLEGEGRGGTPEGQRCAGVDVVHAAGEGDDTIVRVVRDLSPDPVVLVTADRALASRARAVGASVRGPIWLREAMHDEAEGMP